jgi:toxin FitB
VLLANLFSITVILPTHSIAARGWLRAASRGENGKVVEVRDTVIAGIVLARQASLATRNTSHFDDISSARINPWPA